MNRNIQTVRKVTKKINKQIYIKMIMKINLMNKCQQIKIQIRQINKNIISIGIYMLNKNKKKGFNKP